MRVRNKLKNTINWLHLRAEKPACDLLFRAGKADTEPRPASIVEEELLRVLRALVLRSLASGE